MNFNLRSPVGDMCEKNIVLLRWNVILLSSHVILLRSHVITITNVIANIRGNVIVITWERDI